MDPLHGLKPEMYNFKLLRNVPLSAQLSAHMQTQHVDDACSKVMTDYSAPKDEHGVPLTYEQRQAAGMSFGVENAPPEVLEAWRHSAAWRTHRNRLEGLADSYARFTSLMTDDGSRLQYALLLPHEGQPRDLLQQFLLDIAEEAPGLGESSKVQKHLELAFGLVPLLHFPRKGADGCLMCRWTLLNSNPQARLLRARVPFQ